MQASNRLTHWIGAVIAAVSFAVMGGQVVRLWLDPGAWGDVRWVGYMPQLLMAEFAVLGVTVVAAGLCAYTQRFTYRVLIAAGFLFVFFAPSIYVARLLGDEPLVEYLLMLIGVRFLALVGNSAMGLQNLLGRTALSALVLLLVILAMLLVTAFVPMPLGGIDPEVLARVVPWDADTGWEREPQRAFATVVVYCLAMLGVELLLVGPGGGTALARTLKRDEA